MLRQLGPRSPAMPVWLRLNPGFGHGHSRKTNTGGEHSKHGIWHEDLPQALAVIAGHRLQLVGLHMHIGSGVDYGHLQQVCAAMVGARPAGAPAAAGDLGRRRAVDSLPRWRAAHRHRALLRAVGRARRTLAAERATPCTLEIEPGRYLVAESGVLLAEVRAVKRMGSRRFALVDAGFNDLMRPAMYGATTHAPAGADGCRPPTGTHGGGRAAVRVRRRVHAGRRRRGARPRDLPQLQVGDLLVFENAGAYGASMSSNYNSRPLAAEVLVDGERTRLIRRRQTVAELED
jgi:diaminopimelate decarboxylase